MEKWVVTDPEILRALCIKNRWFVNGTSEQYDKMFGVNRIGENDMVFAIRDVALVIWLCSGDIPYNDIFKELNSANEDYLMALADAQQAAAERAADEVYCGYYD
ncbi:MAG: hypothetical protein LIP12_17860 [Clostridiales bacterium]|nr:hypothetical protein [Clostridiales bacterium]